MTIKDMLNSYNAMAELMDSKEFPIKKSFRTKGVAEEYLAQIKVALDEAVKIEAPKTKMPEKAEENQMAKNDVKVNSIQHAVLTSFDEETMLVSTLAENLSANTKNDKAGKIIHAQLGMLKKLGLVEVEGEGAEKSATITKAGEKVASQPAPPAAVVKEKKQRFVAPYSQEEIDGAKKKKAAKMIEENEQARAAFIEANGAEGRTQAASENPSAYKGTVKAGKWQKEHKGKNPSPVRAVWDLFDQIVTEDLKMTSAEFIEECAAHNINKGTAAANFRHMIKTYNLVDALKASKGGKPKVKNVDVPEVKKGKKGKVAPEVVEAEVAENVEEPKKEKKGKKSKK